MGREDQTTCGGFAARTPKGKVCARALPAALGWPEAGLPRDSGAVAEPEAAGPRGAWGGPRREAARQLRVGWPSLSPVRLLVRPRALTSDVGGPRRGGGKEGFGAGAPSAATLLFSFHQCT